MKNKSDKSNCCKINKLKSSKLGYESNNNNSFCLIKIVNNS